MVSEAPHEQPFRLHIRVKGRLRRKLFSLVEGTIERFLLFPRLNSIYADATSMPGDRHFVHKVLSALRVNYDVTEQELARIPATGPVIVVANHPFGALEGIVLASVLRSIRPDVKIMANYLLHRIPELRDVMTFVDPFGREGSVRNNIAAIRQSIEHVRNGGMLGLFPAGEVAHIDLHNRVITDPKWSPTVSRIVRITQAPVLPVFFAGNNGKLFQVLGLVHARLRTVMLPRELLNKQATTICMNVGAPIPFAKLKGFASDEDMTAYLRLRTYILKGRRDARRGGASPRPAAPPRSHLEEIVPAEDPAALAAEVAALPADQALGANGPLTVYYARAPQIPRGLREIGRLRELTFRAANEGTGKAVDLDRFDDYYVHLFVWNTQTREVVGGYRMGPSDEILPQHGIAGLYTSTLFYYQYSLLEQISPFIELGRSFVRREYQKSFSPLMLLWRGIGVFAVRHPRYKMLMGPVSINAEYQTLSKQIIIAFLKASQYAPELGRQIRAKNPPPVVRHLKDLDPRHYSTVVRNIDEVNDLISELESDHKGVPILLKQYVKLGAKLLGFNIDPNFGDVLDGLTLVDLTQTDRKILDRYMGEDNAGAFLAYHQRAAKGGQVSATPPGAE